MSFTPSYVGEIHLLLLLRLATRGMWQRNAACPPGVMGAWLKSL